MRARRSLSLTVALAVSALVLAPLTPAIAALDDWDEPVTIATARSSSSSAQIVADGSSLVAVWLLGTGPTSEVVSARSTDGLTWSSLAFLSEQAPHADETQLVAAGGRITAAWVQDVGGVFRVQTATSTTGGATWSSAATISPAGEAASDVHLATDGATIVATWASDDGSDRRIRVATSANGTSWSTAFQLDSGDDARDPFAAVDGATAVVAWAQFDGDVFTLDVAASTTTGASWSAPRPLPGSGGVRPNVVYDGTQLTVVYPTFEGLLQARASYNLGVDWPLVTGVSSGIDGETFEVDVAADGDDISVIWWVNGFAGLVTQVASSFDGAESWTPVHQVSTATAGNSAPQIALQGDRRVAVWTQVAGDDRRVMVATSDDGGVTWTTAAPLSTAGGDGGAPRVVMAGLRTSVLWNLTETSSARVEVTSFTGQVQVSRLAGSDRFTTAVEVSREYAPFADGEGVVYVANGRDYPDALSAAPAAAFRGAPLLLTERSSVPAAVVAEINRLNPQTIIVVGGTGSVSAAVYSRLGDLAPDIERHAGASRYETSRIVTERAFGSSGADTAYLATGLGFADALAASAAAAVVDAPVILVNGSATSLDAATADLLDELGVTTVKIAGGTGVVSSRIQSALNGLPFLDSVRRLSGSDRFATSQAINADAFSEADEVYLANGYGFADALAGAALAGLDQSPLYVVPANCVPAPVLAAIDELAASRVVLLGGTGTLTSRVASLRSC